MKVETSTFLFTIKAISIVIQSEMDGACSSRSMVPNGVSFRIFCIFFYLAVVFECVDIAWADNERRCRTEKECHFGAIADLVLNISEPVSLNDPLALALARFKVVPHGCADYFEKYVEARNKLPAKLLNTAGSSESLCDSKRIFSGPDMAVATFVAITNAVIIVFLGCAIDKKLHPFESN